MLSITRLGLGLALAGLTACASGGGTNDPAVATAPAVSVQLSHTSSSQVKPRRDIRRLLVACALRI